MKLEYYLEGKISKSWRWIRLRGCGVGEYKKDSWILACRLDGWLAALGKGWGGGGGGGSIYKERKLRGGLSWVGSIMMSFH